MACVFGSAASAAVTPYSWIRGGEFGVMTDSSGPNPSHPFNAAFSSGCEAGAGGGGLTAAVTSRLRSAVRWEQLARPARWRRDGDP